MALITRETFSKDLKECDALLTHITSVVAVSRTFYAPPQSRILQEFILQAEDTLVRRGATAPMVKRFQQALADVCSPDTFIKLAEEWEEVRGSVLNNARDLSWRNAPFAISVRGGAPSKQHCPLIKLQKVFDTFAKGNARVEGAVVVAMPLVRETSFENCYFNATLN